MTEALYFESGQQRLFGWLHNPSVTHGAMSGLVICKPFGYESVCSHRSVRAFAESAAAIGMPVLRFDYLGTGDSAEIDSQADQIAVWSQDVTAAVAELRRRTGVEHVYLLGLRIGALLATLVASRSESVAGLILIAPILSGRRYVKELRTTRLASLIGVGTALASKEGAADESPDRLGSFEVSGFTLSDATLATLGAVDLRGAQLHHLRRMLIIDNNALPAAREWADDLGRSGLAVTYKSLPGMVEMLMTSPQFAVVPQAMIVATREWLMEKVSANFRPPDPNYAPSMRHDGAPIQNVLTLSAGSEVEALLTERAIRFGPDRLLFGVVTEPPQDERRRRAVILLNAGATQHIGASRLNVSLARQWGSRGYVVLRLDLAGLGDSDTRRDAKDDDVFPASALHDIRAAIDYLKEHYRVGEITLGGLCSGAYHALRAAAAGIAVARILMINPQNYFWEEGMSLTDLQAVEVLRNPGVYRQQVFSKEAWMRVLGGEVNLWRIVKVYVLRASIAFVSLAQDLARWLHIPLPKDLGRELEEIAERGVGIVFIFARGEPGLDLLKLEGGRSLRRLGNKCRIYALQTGDHVFSHRNSRCELERVLSNELLSPVLPKNAV